MVDHDGIRAAPQSERQALDIAVIRLDRHPEARDTLGRNAQVIELARVRTRIAVVEEEQRVIAGAAVDAKRIAVDRVAVDPVQNAGRGVRVGPGADAHLVVVVSAVDAGLDAGRSRLEPDHVGPAAGLKVEDLDPRLDLATRRVGRNEGHDDLLVGAGRVQGHVAGGHGDGIRLAVKAQNLEPVDIVGRPGVLNVDRTGDVVGPFDQVAVGAAPAAQFDPPRACRAHLEAVVAATAEDRLDLEAAIAVLVKDRDDAALGTVEARHEAVGLQHMGERAPHFGEIEDVGPRRGVGLLVDRRRDHVAVLVALDLGPADARAAGADHRALRCRGLDDGVIAEIVLERVAVAALAARHVIVAQAADEEVVAVTAVDRVVVLFAAQQVAPCPARDHVRPGFTHDQVVARSP